MKFSVIGVVIAVMTLIAEIVLLYEGYGDAAGICLVFGIMASGIFRFLSEMKGE